MLRYAEVTQDDFDQMLELYERFLNSGESIAAHLREGLSDPKYLGVKCMDGERMVGVFSCRPGIEFTCGHEDIAMQIQTRWEGYRIFTGDVLAVLPEYRGQGIARRLAQKLRELLKRNGCDCFVAEQWRRSVEGDVPASGLLKYIGSCVSLGTYDEFYRDSKRYGIKCPECGVHCRCGAIVCVVEVR